MTDYSLSSITRVEQSIRNSSEPNAGQMHPVDQAVQVSAPKPAQPETVAKAEKREPGTLLPITSNNNVSLRFQVDEDTHNITVFVVDRASQRVLRSIPPEELNKMQAGDLLKLVV